MKQICGRYRTSFFPMEAHKPLAMDWTLFRKTNKTSHQLICTKWCKWNNTNLLLHNFFLTKRLKLIFPLFLLQFSTLCIGSLDNIAVSVSLRIQTYKRSLIPCKQDNVLGCLFTPHCNSPFDINQFQVIFFVLSLSGNQTRPAGFPAALDNNNSTILASNWVVVSRSWSWWKGNNDYQYMQLLPQKENLIVSAR